MITLIIVTRTWRGYGPEERGTYRQFVREIAYKAVEFIQDRRKNGSPCSLEDVKPRLHAVGRVIDEYGRKKMGRNGRKIISKMAFDSPGDTIEDLRRQYVEKS